MEKAAFGMPPLPAEALTCCALCVGTGGNVGGWTLDWPIFA